MAGAKRQKDFAIIKYLADYRVSKIGGSPTGSVQKYDDKSKDVIFCLPFGTALVGITVHFVGDLSRNVNYELDDVFAKYGNPQGNIDSFVDSIIAFLNAPRFKKNVITLSKGDFVSLDEVITGEDGGKSDALTAIVRMLGSLKRFIAREDIEIPLTNELLTNEWYDDYDWHDAMSCMWKAVGLGIVALLGLILTAAATPVFLLILLPALAGAGYFGWNSYKKQKKFRKKHPIKK